MKKFFYLLLLMPVFTMAQFKPAVPRKEKIVTDSTNYYEKQLRALQKQAMDSLFNSEDYQDLLNKYKSHVRKSHNYTAFTLYTDFVHTDYGTFNELITQKGFAPLNEMSPRFGLGISTKQKWLMLDFYFATFGLNAKVKKGEETIKASLSNALHIDLGVDVLKSKAVSLYPYGGLSMRMSNLSYQKPEIINPNYTDITDIVVENRTVNSSSTRVGYQAGIGFDVAIGNNKERNTATFFFVKAGVNRPIGKDKYKIYEADYRPNIKQGVWCITVGVKFATRD
jgi:hypothetical protein